MTDLISSFDAFFDEHYDPVVRTLSLITSDRARAEDAAQEAFATAYRKWPSVSRLDRPAGWVVVVGTNRLKRWFVTEERRLTRFRAAGVAPADLSRPGDGDVLDPGHAVAVSTTLRDALDVLPPRQRATVVLRYLCDLPTKDVAKALGCSPGTVKSALHSALASLRVELDDEEPDADPASGAGPPRPARSAPARQEVT